MTIASHKFRTTGQWSCV